MLPSIISAVGEIIPLVAVDMAAIEIKVDIAAIPTAKYALQHILFE